MAGRTSEMEECSQFPINGVVSRGSTQHWLAVMSRSLKFQRFPWTLIQTQSDLVQIRLRVAGQFRFFGRYWRNSPFVFSFEPRWSLRITEVNLHLRSQYALAS